MDDKPVEYTVGFPFCGIGAGALGFLQARAKLCGLDARFRSVGGIDNNPDACRDFEYLTGSPALCADVAAMTPEELRAFWPECPDVIFSSPPCKANSGLMSKRRAETARYQKMNRLVVDWLRLIFTAYETRPKLLLIENVPGIQSRGKALLAEIKRLLRAEGYLFHEGTHQCGELGGLAQLRTRYLLVARRPKEVPPLLYSPPKLRVRGCGEVIGLLPLPDGGEGGAMHTMPKLSWKNWLRLALIPAGGDWRDLPGVLEGRKRREVFQRYRIEQWTEPTMTVDGPGTNGTYGVADPRPEPATWFNNVLTVRPWEAPARTITGASRVTGGLGSVADPRPEHPEWFRGVYGVTPWDAPAKTVTGGAGHPVRGPFSVADPRVVKSARPGAYGVRPWDKPSRTIIGAARVDNGTFSVADPRASILPQAGNPNLHEGKYRVRKWEEPSKTVTGTGRVGSGLQSVADPRIKTGFDHAYRVLRWEEPAFTIAGKTHPGCGAYTVADPRTQAACLLFDEDGGLVVVDDVEHRPTRPPVLIADDGTWHRPFTPLENGVLQGLPATVNGAPLQLAGKKRDGWCERIGNAVPVGTAKAIATQMLVTLVHASVKGFALSSTPVWVDRAAPTLHHHASMH